LNYTEKDILNLNLTPRDLKNTGFILMSYWAKDNFLQSSITSIASYTFVVRTDEKTILETWVSDNFFRVIIEKGDTSLETSIVDMKTLHVGLFYTEYLLEKKREPTFKEIRDCKNYKSHLFCRENNKNDRIKFTGLYYSYRLKEALFSLKCREINAKKIFIFKTQNKFEIAAQEIYLNGINLHKYNHKLRCVYGNYEFGNLKYDNIDVGEYLSNDTVISYLSSRYVNLRQPLRQSWRELKLEKELAINKITDFITNTRLSNYFGERLGKLKLDKDLNKKLIRNLCIIEDEIQTGEKYLTELEKKANLPLKDCVKEKEFKNFLKMSLFNYGYKENLEFHFQKFKEFVKNPQDSERNVSTFSWLLSGEREQKQSEMKSEVLISQWLKSEEEKEKKREEEELLKKQPPKVITREEYVLQEIEPYKAEEEDLAVTSSNNPWAFMFDDEEFNEFDEMSFANVNDDLEANVIEFSMKHGFDVEITKQNFIKKTKALYENYGTPEWEFESFEKYKLESFFKKSYINSLKLSIRTNWSYEKVLKELLDILELKDDKQIVNALQLINELNEIPKPAWILEDKDLDEFELEVRLGLRQEAPKTKVVFRKNRFAFPK